MVLSPLTVLLALLVGWLGWLVVERVRLGRHRRAIPLRIAVTGSRGKTSVTRLLAAVLRESGRTVLAKTTGSEARYVLPDGSEEEIHRIGPPSVVEQRRLLARAARSGADVVVAEIMSVHPEVHRVEAQRILQPHLVLVTNFRVDHPAAQGDTRDSVARVLALDVPLGSRALVLREEWEPAFAERVLRAGGTLEAVEPGVAPADPCDDAAAWAGFPPNLELVWAAARSQGIDDATIRAGICRAQGDVGALRVWRYPRAEGEPPWLVANAFAANDPESTRRVYERVGAQAGSCVGLLCLRPDRGDRTLQWAAALADGALGWFRRVYVHGLHAHALRHRLRRVEGAVERGGGGRVVVLGKGSARQLMQRILEAEGGRGGLLFGFGNIHGIGEMLVRHWRTVGDAHGL